MRALVDDTYNVFLKIFERLSSGFNHQKVYQIYGHLHSAQNILQPMY